MIKKYYKLPIEIEAIQFKRSYAEMAVNFIGKENIDHYNIKTLEGIMEASEGDYIIKIKGEVI